MAALLAGLALGLVAVAVFTGTTHKTAPLPPGPGIVAAGTLSPPVVLFGDPLTAEVDVFVDRRRIDPRLIRLRTPFLPFVPVSQTSSRRDVGKVTELQYSFRLRCLTTKCLPPLSRKRYFAFPPALVIYRQPSGSGSYVTSIPVRFPAVGIASRLSAEAVRDARRRTGPLRVIEGAAPGVGLQEAAQLVQDDAQHLPSASYTVSPALLVAILLVLAALLALAAVIVVVRYVRPRPRPAKPKPEAALPPMSPLEYALGELDVALANGEVERQRKALERLARELGQSGESGLADEARQLAWGAGSLPRDDARALARTVRLSLNGEKDGDAE